MSEDKKNVSKKVDEFLGEEENKEVCDEQGKCYIKTDKGFIDKNKEHTRENRKVIVDNDGRELLT